MKAIILAISLLFTVAVHADDQSACDQAKAKGADCKVVKVLTKCDMDKYKLQKRIEELKRQLAAAEAQASKSEVKEVVVEKVVTKKVVETRTKVKHHIISIFGHPAATNTTSTTSSSSGSATAHGSVDMRYVPGLLYQYQFNFGLVPMIGVDTQKQLVFGLGFEF